MTATAKVGGKYFVRGEVISEEVAKEGHPSLIDLGLAALNGEAQISNDGLEEAPVAETDSS